MNECSPKSIYYLSGIIPYFWKSQQNQITKEERELFDISNNFFKMCELSDEYEVISLNDITNKIFLTDLCYKKKNLIFATTFVTVCIM